MLTAMERLHELEVKISSQAPDVRLRFTTQSFAKHVELWVYVLDSGAYERVQTLCQKLDLELRESDFAPEIWIVPRPWSGPWPGGSSAEELSERRETFRRTHSLRQPAQT